LLGGLKTQAQSALADIRRLVYALRPPALDDLGLLGAIDETAAQYSSNGLRVSVEAPGRLPPLPAAVEVAAYRIVQEALTNVVRHAEASECVIRLALDEADRTLRLEIRDDGCGLPAERRRGVGVASMRERAAELGGECVVESFSAGGTRVRASLPYTPGAAELSESEE
jgi:signal transduction histidine kinase